MATVKEELVNGAGSQIDAQTGRTDVRSFYLEGLTLGTSDATAAGFWDEVYNELAARNVFVPAIHPYNGTLVCSRIVPSPFSTNSRTQARALAYYVESSSVSSSVNIVRFRAWTQPILTSRYADRSLILVDYTGPDGTVFPKQLGRVPGTKAVGKLIIERQVTSDPEPLLVCLNKQNSGTYRGQDEGSFLCTAIAIDPTGDGRWRVVGEFDYDEMKHVVPAFYTNPVTGEPYPDIIGGVGGPGSYDPDVEAGNGFVNNRLQDLIDFSAYGF